jgi:hypothetical protein
MGPGGLTENIIAHFAGYLKFTDDFVRARPTYDDGPHQAHAKPSVADLTTVDTPDRTLDDLPTQPYRLPYSPGAFSLIGAFPPHPPTHALPKFETPPWQAPEELPPPVLSAPGGGGGGGEIIMITTAEAPTHDQLLFSATQINLMQNNDVDLMIPGTRVTSLHTTDDPALLSHMISTAQALAPVDLAPQGSGTPLLVHTVAAHDAREAASPDPAHVATLQQGITDNGVLQPAGVAFNPTAPTVVDVTVDTSHNGMTNPGLDAQTGGNVSVNAASILDDNTQRTGLVVMGDAYTTNAIIQTNELYSHAQIEVGGATVSREIVTGGNVTDNLASFNQHDLSIGAVNHFSPTANVQVDEINGNFYDVKGIVQTNYLSDNDVVVQGTTSSFNEVDTGNNNQINYLPLSELNANYDVIIVEGSFHRSNVISQTNILLNDDIAMMFSGRSDTASQSITTGDNTLSNAASIDNYGNTTFHPLTAALTASMAGLESGNVDQLIASLLPGNGTQTLHVLLITGDFYDLNYIQQTNVISNADTVAQYLPQSGNGVAPTGAATSSTETINSGSNQLANIAQIVTAGTLSDFQFLGGQKYDDAILVQANLVTDKSQVTVGDTQTLAPELVAFTGLHDASQSDQTAHPAPTSNADAAHQQDLFHGVMS